jgi:hypothetical protein
MEYQKTHNYKILKTYTPEEIKAHGNDEFFLDEEVTDKRIKLRRAHILNKIGYQCVHSGCELRDFHFGLGIDKGGGLHLDLYGYDQDDELVMVTIDHKKPKSKGGKDKISNYEPMCKPHNEMKANEHNFNRNFVDLTTIYPDHEIHTNNYLIKKSILTQDEMDVLVKRDHPVTNPYLNYFVVGKEYVSLVKKGEGVMMSNHPSETMTNQDFINQAYGDVIIFGLGLGMIVLPLLKDKDIKSITVIEYDEGVIDAVGNILKTHDPDNKLTIIQGDAFQYHEKINPKVRRFDTIYFDIWIAIDEEVFSEMEHLHDLYRGFLRSNLSYIHSWCYELKGEFIKK